MVLPRLQWLLINCRLGLNTVAVDRMLTGWLSSVTCLTRTGSYRWSCQRIAPPGLSTIDAAPVVPVLVGPVCDPVVITRLWLSSSQSRGSGSSICGCRSSQLPSRICRAQPAAPAVSVACRRQYLLLTAPVLVSVAHSSSTVDPLAPPGRSGTRSSSSFCSLLL